MPCSPSSRLAAVSCLIFLAFGLGGCGTETVPVAAPSEQAYAPPPPLPPLPPSVPTRPTEPLVDTGGRTDIALLLPLSGPNSALGHDMLDAAELAVSELAGDGIALTPKDTRGSPDGAADAARRAMAERAKLIIGPLTAAEVQAVKPIAAAGGVNVLAFSNQVQVAGDGVFLLGFLPQEEARRVAIYAHSTGIDSFAVLAPSTPYGRLAAQSFQDAVGQAGGTVSQVQFYDPGLADPRAAAQSLAQSARPGFGGVLLPEPDPRKLKFLASVLPVYNIGAPQVRLLGIDSWDLPDLGSEPTLVGGWYAAPSSDARAGFADRFAKAYGHAPLRLATLAYDAVGIAVALQKTPGSSFSTDALTNPSGFAGADGVFRLRADGTCERGLAVLQVERHGVTVISPAPETFEETGQ